MQAILEKRQEAAAEAVQEGGSFVGVASTVDSAASAVAQRDWLYTYRRSGH
jgi:hypothetical protein